MRLRFIMFFKWFQREWALLLSVFRLLQKVSLLRANFTPLCPLALKTHIFCLLQSNFQFALRVSYPQAP